MSIPCIAVDATMFAALVWIHRPGKTNVRAGYLIENGFGMGFVKLGFDCRFIGFPVLVIVVESALIRGILLESRRWIDLRSSSVLV